jgi:hypothetical protein
MHWWLDPQSRAIMTKRLIYSGHPLPASATGKLLERIREERDQANLGNGE